MKIELMIDRIVIDGIALPTGESRRLRATLERELTRLLASADAAVPDSAQASDRLRAPELHLPAAVSGSELGRELARSLHAAIAPRPASAPAPLPARDVNPLGVERP